MTIRELVQNSKIEYARICRIHSNGYVEWQDTYYEKDMLLTSPFGYSQLKEYKIRIDAIYTMYLEIDEILEDK